MSRKQFEQLARRFESCARQHPAQYKLKIALAAALGYASMLVVPGVILAIGARLLLSLRHEAVPGVNSITLAAGIALLTAIMLRTFWVRLSPPSGFEVRREETPRLFLLIDKLTNALNTTPLHQVFIVNELQAVVVPTPRIGLFGRHQHTLLLGLPLMLATTPVQFRALLVHEFSHLSRHHDRFSAWSYRTRLVWTRLLEELTARDHWSSLPLRKFLSWYVPYFNACSLALARAQECEADRLAALDQIPDKPDAPEPPVRLPRLRDPHEATAANYYLDAHATATREALDRQWADAVADEWNRKHQEMAAARARCQALSDKSATVGLSIDELWEYACQMEALESDAAALPLLLQLLAKQPDHASANLAMGRLLLAQNDQAGLPYLEKALAADPETVIPACRLASGFLERLGNHKESLRYRIKAQRHLQQLLDAGTEQHSPKSEAPVRTARTLR